VRHEGITRRDLYARAQQTARNPAAHDARTMRRGGLAIGCCYADNFRPFED